MNKIRAEQENNVNLEHNFKDCRYNAVNQIKKYVSYNKQSNYLNKSCKQHKKNQKEAFNKESKPMDKS
jgi:predicted AAA+ superfamily ATPase